MKQEEYIERIWALEFLLGYLRSSHYNIMEAKN